ncbi:hypothetical protein SAMN05192562_102302 [Kosakonia arachidis]|uniref:Uncharacterized protein n=1 Tax=Kosakonia arachidis TaxID=551989 RepID=A0A1I7B5I2_9ENTR|nr:hypothetical protein SAMN05192562_102302 [Kosakonia arachidis]
MAEGVRSRVSALQMPHDASPIGFITISIGLATLQSGKPGG